MLIDWRSMFLNAFSNDGRISSFPLFSINSSLIIFFIIRFPFIETKPSCQSILMKSWNFSDFSWALSQARIFGLFTSLLSGSHFVCRCHQSDKKCRFEHYYSFRKEMQVSCVNFERNEPVEHATFNFGHCRRYVSFLQTHSFDNYLLPFFVHYFSESLSDAYFKSDLCFNIWTIVCTLLEFVLSVPPVLYALATSTPASRRWFPRSPQKRLYSCLIPYRLLKSVVSV